MIEFGLTGMEWKLLQVLVTQGHPSKPMMIAELYPTLVSPPDQKILDVMVCKMRKKLKPFGVEIHTHHGRGYYLDPTDKHMLLVQVRSEMLRRSGELIDEVAT